MRGDLAKFLGIVAILGAVATPHAMASDRDRPVLRKCPLVQKAEDRASIYGYGYDTCERNKPEVVRVVAQDTQVRRPLRVPVILGFFP